MLCSVLGLTCIKKMVFVPLCFFSYQVQVEEGSGDALDSAHRVFWVYRFIAFHHNVPVEVQLPLDGRVI